MDLTRSRFGKYRYFKTMDFNSMLAISHRPAQCSDQENQTYCTPTLGRLEKILLQSSTNVTNWEDSLQYEPFWKAYFQELEPQHDISRYYQKLVQVGQFI